MDIIERRAKRLIEMLEIRRDKLKPREVPVKNRIEAPCPSKSTKKSVERKVERVVTDSTKPVKPQDMDVDQEDATEGHFELNELMTRILEEELQTIMIEVWQAIPDDPPTDIERYVAEKLRNEVSDDLCSVLGLNVTKRLLNVYNPLFVKLRFSRRPESGCLTKFLDAYNIRSFKRLNKETNTFAAKLDTITDFDNICASREIRCGTAKITVIPCYKFTLCPKKINTKFADKDEESKTENDSKDLNDENDEVVPKLEENELKSDESKTVEKTQNIETHKKSVNDIKANQMTEVTKTIPVKENAKDIPKPIETKKEIQKTINPIKVEPVKSTSIPQKETQAETQKSPLKAEVNVKPKPMLKKEIPVETTKQNQVDTQKTKTPTKVEETAKVKAILKKEPQVETQKAVKSVIPKPFVKKEPQNTKFKPKETKPSPKEKIAKKVELNTEDLGDEMNDEEILALISSGVIVDECSGSDSE